MIKIGIDASNLRSGGAQTHLRELILNSENSNHLFDTIIVWASEELNKKLPKKKWIKYIDLDFSRNGIRKILWKFLPFF